MSRRLWLRVALVVVTVACAWLTSRLRVSTDVSAMIPTSGDAEALGTWMRAFEGAEPALIAVEGEDTVAVKDATAALAAELRKAPSIARVLEGPPRPPLPTDPSLAWAYAGPTARAKLAAIVAPGGMRARLQETRALLLAPASDEHVQAWLARDPLRLWQVPWEGHVSELVSGVSDAPDGTFVARGGRMRLLIAEPRGRALESAPARALVEDVGRAEAAVARPGVRFELAGAHAIAFETEQLMRRDLEISATASTLLASLAFVLTFRRLRALVAVLPPLALGTLWTTGLAALLPSGLDALAIAFAAVVVGVGVDTGVHVYGAVLDARRQGLAPAAAAAAGRDATWRPTMTAALVAALAFASLALGDLPAMRELGLLCGAGELLTAVAILLVTPEISILLERSTPPPWRPARWMGALAWATATRGRALIVLAACFAPAVVVSVTGWPAAANALIAVRPKGLPAFAAEADIREAFGGRAEQWFLVTRGTDATEVRARADRIAEALEPLVLDGTLDGFDALSTLAPSSPTVASRLAARDALDLPSRRPALEAALREAGFDVSAFTGALDAFAHPSPPLAEMPSDDALAWFQRRHVAHEGAETIVATYIRPSPGREAAAEVRSVVARVDSTTRLTGLDAVERVLRELLPRDLVVVGAVALLLVAVAMRLALRRMSAALVALATLGCEMGLVGLSMRLLGLRWHVYDALVVPVLFGITIDESMFLLHAAAARPLGEALAKQGPLVAATALTTAAGFAALGLCRYTGLHDLGLVGTLGVLAGLVAALLVVPSAMRLMSHRAHVEGATPVAPREPPP
jgi:predicted RND superfamily exporter protein